MISERADSLAASPITRYPIRWSCFGCCASATGLSAKSIAHRVRQKIFLCPDLPIENRQSKIENCIIALPLTLHSPRLLDDLVRSEQDRLWNRQSDLFHRL